MHLRSIRLENIREFGDMTLGFEAENGGARPWTVVVGVNGVGKTTLLRSIALGFADESDAGALLASSVGRMIGEGGDTGRIELTVSERRDSEERATLVTNIKRVGDREIIRRESDGPIPDWANAEPFLAGYGIARMRSGRESVRAGRIFDTTQSLFDYDALLTPVELTLRRIRDFLGTSAYDAAMTGIKKALNLPAETQIIIASGGGMLVSNGPNSAPVPLEGWADGFRLNFSWIVDFFGVALASGALLPDGSIRGVLLLDEIEQHTHPSTQDMLIAEFKALWPHLQAIVTTHSPLIVLGAQAEEVIVLKQDAKGEVVQAPRPASFNGYTAEDILTDKRLFDTEARSAEETSLVEDYKTIASIPEEGRTQPQRERLATLAKSIRGIEDATPGIAVAGEGGVADLETMARAMPPRRPTGPLAEADLVEDLRQLRAKYNL